MLAIQREPLFKNKFFLGAVALIAGFLVTLVIIRIVAPADTSTNESAQSSSSRRASQIPVTGTESESNAEKEKSAESNDAAPTSPATTPSTNNSQWSAPAQSSGTSWTATSSPQPAPATQQPAAAAPAQSQPSSSSNTQPAEGSQCSLTSSIGLPIVGSIVGGVCRAL